jgi:hypothetical protein
VLFDFECLAGAPLPRHIELDNEGIINRGELIGEFNVNDRADDLDDFAFVHALSFNLKWWI